MPITSVGNQFTRVWEERQMFLLIEGIRHQLMMKGISPNDVHAAFAQVRAALVANTTRAHLRLAVEGASP